MSVFSSIITTTTASFVPNVCFTTDYQELAPDSSKITIMMMMMMIKDNKKKKKSKNKNKSKSCPK